MPPEASWCATIQGHELKIGFESRVFNHDWTLAPLCKCKLCKFTD